MPDTGTITSDARFTGCGGTCPIASSAPIRLYARATAMNISTSSGMTIATSHAPARNLLTSSMIVTAKVSTAPTPLMMARYIQDRPTDRRPLQVPVLHHPRLGQGEADEDPDREQRHQRLGVTADHDEQQRGGDREHPDAVAEYPPVRPQTEHVRQEVVVREQPGQHRQPAERGVGGQREQHQRDELDDVVEHVVPDRALGQLREHGRPRLRHRVPVMDQQAQPDQHPAEQQAEPHLGVLRPSTRGLRNCGTELAIASTPVSAEQPDANAFRISSRPTVSVDRGQIVAERYGRVAADQADHDHGEDRDDERERRHHEEPGGLGHPPQVGPGDRREHRQAEPYPGAVQRGVGGGQRLHAGRHPDGRVQYVVDGQRGRGDQRRRGRRGGSWRRRRRPRRSGTPR